MSARKKTDTPDKKSPRNIKSEFNEAAEKNLFAGHILPANGRHAKLTGKRFVITSAQNNTEVHPGFLKALEAYCKDQDAQLLVSRFTYNKKAYDRLEDGELWYDPKLVKYFFDGSAEITKKIVIGGELDITPTAVNPLSGFDNYFQGASGIVPHPKVAMKSLPGLGEDNARFLCTTGAVTQRNYIEKKAGQKAEFHHNFGALLVEVDENGTFFVRQLAADNTGTFQDLTNKYTPDGKVHREQPVEAVTLGDIHTEKLDPVQNAVAFDKGGILDTLKPKYMFIHDLMDFTARNHHNMKDPFFWAEQRKKGNTVEGGFDLVAAWLKAAERPGTTNMVVESNHDEAFGRWLREADARFDPENARFWHEASALMLREIEKGNFNPNIFEDVLRAKVQLENTKFLRDGESFVIAKDEDGRGVETAMHGHTGPNGARGSPNAYRAMDTKANTGHTHSAGIVDGVYTSGVTGALDMGYNKGPSSWSHSHIVTYPNGKRSIITVKDGKWRADDKKHEPLEIKPLAPAAAKKAPKLAA
ncbi:MAG TPA: hypothetical protein VEF76_05465 [Patescibacteria group bacterium]|nr:hypothetical protein [Patescibacteria group bacterium]